MKILHLTLKKKWFDMIARGEKREEYREIKLYWKNRLTNTNKGECFFKDFDIVRFTNGYSKDAPVMDVMCEGIEIGAGWQEWGAEPNERYFVIRLGAILSIKNYIDLFGSKTAGYNCSIELPAVQASVATEAQ